MQFVITRSFIFASQRGLFPSGFLTEIPNAIILRLWSPQALFHLPSFDQLKNTSWANWPQGHKPKAVL